MARSLNIDWDKQPLGKISDRELAEKLNCHHGSVFYQRTKRNIPPKRDIDRNSIIGKRFGNLLIKSVYLTEPSKITRRTTSKAICECNCGREACEKECHVRVIDLKRGSKTRCKNGISHKLPPGEAGKNMIWRRYMDRSKKKNISFNLSKEEFFKITQSNCYYCGLPPSQKAKTTKGTFIYNGIDRIDNSEGYLFDNCVPCCKTCNTMKHALSYEEFMERMKRILTIRERIDF